MTLIDVRSPKEYAEGHIPSAINIPLFNNSERAEVGLTYKQKGPKEALHLGLAITGPKLATFLEIAEKIPQPLKVYCARGGMRSEAMLWLFSFAKIKASRLEGGYKKWRRHVLSLFSHPWNLQIIGGLTGSGKTDLLITLKKSGHSILDLEALAAHRGSSFGAIPTSQPTQEQFENLIAKKLEAVPNEAPLFVEDESRFVGKCKIPDPFFLQMRKAPLFLVEKTKEERIEHLVKEYGTLPKEALKEAFLRLEKRLGRERMKEAIFALEAGDLAKSCHIALDYYDKSYQHSLAKRSGTINPYEYIHIPIHF